MPFLTIIDTLIIGDNRLIISHSPLNQGNVIRIYFGDLLLPAFNFENISIDFSWLSIKGVVSCGILMQHKVIVQWFVQGFN